MLKNIKKNFSDLKTYINNSRSKVYRATQNNGTRRVISPSILSQDKHVNVNDRNVLNASTYDLMRNCGLIAFAINTHLNYIASFNLQVKTGNQQFDKQVQAKMKWWSNSENCDISKRFSFNQMIRLIEKTRFLAGDVLVIKTENTKLQIIEGDRIANPTQIPEQFTNKINLADYEHGLKIDKYTGQVKKYLVCERTSGTTRKLQAIVDSQDCMFLAYRPRIDSYRGYAPLSAAINNAKDLMDGQQFLLMKIRLTALLGFVITRQSTDALGRNQVSGVEKSSTDVDMTMAKPSLFDMKPGQDVKVIEGTAARTQTINFYKDMAMQILRSVDIPYSFYSEDFSNFYGSRGAVIQYEKSCQPKRQALVYMLNNITRWLISNWILDGSLILPKGININNINFEWISSGTNLWKPTEELMGIAYAASMGIMSFADATKSLGGDWYENIDKLKQEYAHAKAQGVPITLPNVSSNINLSNTDQSIANNK